MTSSGREVWPWLHRGDDGIWCYGISDADGPLEGGFEPTEQLAAQRADELLAKWVLQVGR